MRARDSRFVQLGVEERVRDLDEAGPRLEGVGRPWIFTPGGAQRSRFRRVIIPTGHPLVHLLGFRHDGVRFGASRRRLFG